MFLQARPIIIPVADTQLNVPRVVGSATAQMLAENTAITPFLLQPVREGLIELPAGDIAEPFIDVDDLADVAVATLTTEGHVGATYELTGPRLLTFADVAEELTRAIGRTVRYRPVTPQEYAEAAARAGVPVEEVEPLTELFTRVLDGHNAHLTHDVERVLGRRPTDFADYARDAAATGVWTAGTLAGTR